MNQGKKVNRYGPPHFNKDGIVSIWLSTVPLSQIPDDYFEENYGDEEKPLTKFYGDFGFGYFDHDFMDTNTATDDAATVAKLLGECSFSASYVESAVAEAKRRGLEKTYGVVLLYNFEYDPEQTGISKSKYMEFLGCFPYDDEASRAIPQEAE